MQNIQMIKESKHELLNAIMVIVRNCNKFLLLDNMMKIISLDDIYDDDKIKDIAYNDSTKYNEILNCFRENMKQDVLFGGFNISGDDDNVYGADPKYYELYKEM